MNGPLCFFLRTFTLFLACNLSAQSKRDYQWVIGYDHVAPQDEAILLNFNLCPVDVSPISTVYSFSMEGSNTSMSDEAGNLLFYSNGCYIVNAAGEIMENGDTINPGWIQDSWCPSGGALGHKELSQYLPPDPTVFIMYSTWIWICPILWWTPLSA